MRALIFDTETTGLIDFNAPLGAPQQPRITQLAALLCDEEGNELKHMNFYIRPDGWTVPPEITEKFGVTNEMLEKGIWMRDALWMFNGMVEECTIRVGHNISFDRQMIAREEVAYDLGHFGKGKPFFCTMNESKNICKLPPTQRMLDKGMKGFKNPSLQEAYVHFFGKEFESAHDAMADVRACKGIFYKLMEEKKAAA